MLPYDSIGFDLDGTLWDPAENITPAWNAVFKRESLPYSVTAANIHGVMGLNIYQIAQKLFPALEKEDGVALVRRCCKEQNGYLLKKGGVLYPNLQATLEKLSQKYKLYIVSNCDDGYIEAFLDYHKELKPYFCDFTCPAYTDGASKGKNIRLVMERNQLKNSVYVGDTAGDQNAAKEAGLPFIFAAYGFGCAEAPDCTIGAFDELLTLAE